jgi:uncharacterized protein YbjT (DUF2867 family)
MNTQGMTLVLGGTGKTGRRVAGRLQARGVPTRVATRSGDRPFDWEERRTWAPALQGASAVYLSFFPDLAVPGAAGTVGVFAELAVAAGVRRLVLLSGRGEEDDREFAAAMREQLLPGDVVSLMTYLFTEVLDGRNARLADGVQRALGREPCDFGDYARRTAAAGIWDGGR